MFQRRKRVLIVDDEERLAQMVKMNLEDSGNYTVRVEKFGSQSLEAAQAFHPDLVLMDVMMRDCGGAVSAQKIKSDKRFKNVPIVYFTAAIPKPTLTESAPDLLGGYPYVSKPAKTDRLIATIERYIDKK